MAWVTPKTNWQIRYDESNNYIGDYFNASDFNRIKNNLGYLRELACELYPSFAIEDLGSDRVYSDFGPYADEINTLERNLYTININTLNIEEYMEYPVYSPNELIMGVDELNRIESATLDIYNTLNNQYSGRRMLTIKLGVPNDGFLHGM